MRIIFSIFVIIHGLIHILGFLKGFGIKEVKELSLSISKPLGLMWLAASILLLVYASFQLTSNKYGWAIGFVAVILSQILVIHFWADAKFGTLPNIIILVVSIIGYGNYNFHQLTERETNQLLDRSTSSNEIVIAAPDIENLPEPVKKWLIRSGMVGKPDIKVGKLYQHAKMKLKPEQEDWMSATALQYSTITEPAFIWTANVKMNSLLSFQGRDKFEEGKGEMLIKLNSIINVVNEKGVKIDEGAMQRYLGEMVWFPSLALSSYIRWEVIDSTSAKATMEYKGTTGSGIFYFNSDGDFVKFSALRFMGNKKDSEKHPWVLRVDGYKEFEGIRVPALMSATWELKDGDWTWLRLEIMDLKFNENINQ